MLPTAAGLEAEASKAAHKRQKPAGVEIGGLPYSRGGVRAVITAIESQLLPGS
jgi:hypothetical protein